jgi:hypothetical protein
MIINYVHNRFIVQATVSAIINYDRNTLTVQETGGRRVLGSTHYKIRGLILNGRESDIIRALDGSNHPA